MFLTIETPIIVTKLKAAPTVNQTFRNLCSQKLVIYGRPTRKLQLSLHNLFTKHN